MTKKECAQILGYNNSVRPTTSNAWRIECSDDGFYSIRAFARTGESASWGLQAYYKGCAQ